MNLQKLILLALSVSLVACGKAPPMPDYGMKVPVKKKASVELLDPKDVKSFSELPLSGKAQNQTKFWSGDYWALNRGNINIRWNSPNEEGYDLISPTKDEAMVMSRDELAMLSASEKFDLLQGRYDYPLKAQVYTHADRLAQDWEGICNGWAPASMNHNEPLPKDLVNPDGILIPFGSSDIKALLSYYYAFIHKVQTTEQMGRRCPRGPWFNWNQDCRNDLNAGSFHIILANKVGRQHKSFLVDIERYKEVWNHPVISYYSEILGEVDLEGNEAEGTKKAIRLQTTVNYVDESDHNTWGPIFGTPDEKSVSREYRYDLYLDENHEIIGGKWKSSDRPDFLWMMGPTLNFEGLLSGLSVLLND